jgi:hypothetical protein
VEESIVSKREIAAVENSSGDDGKRKSLRTRLPWRSGAFAAEERKISARKMPDIIESSAGVVLVHS